MKLCFRSPFTGRIAGFASFKSEAFNPLIGITGLSRIGIGMKLSNGGNSMLMALLYCEEDQISAAAPADEQIPYGDEYWTDIFAGVVPSGTLFETAYITINNADLRRRLLLLGFEDEICGRELASEIESNLTPEYLQGRVV